MQAAVLIGAPDMRIIDDSSTPFLTTRMHALKEQVRNLHLFSRVLTSNLTL